MSEIKKCPFGHIFGKSCWNTNECNGCIGFIACSIKQKEQKAFSPEESKQLTTKELTDILATLNKMLPSKKILLTGSYALHL